MERRLPTVVLLDSSGSQIENFGEPASQHLYDEHVRDRIRSFFKPSIGVNLERNSNPLPHQTQYEHQEALHYTKLLLKAVLEQLRVEKWRSRPFDETVHFAFAYPVHWRDEYSGKIFAEFEEIVLDCLPGNFNSQIDFVTEPEAALLSLQHQRLLSPRTKNVLLVDSGGSTTDLTAGELNERGKMVSTQRYGTPYGGGLYDDEIARYIAKELNIPQSELDNDLNSMHLLRGYARQLKESLSRQMLSSVGKITPPQRNIAIILNSDKTYRNTIKLDEATFHQITRDLTTKLEQIIDDGLQTMRLHERSVDQVALVGGSAQLFTIVHYLQQRFGKQKVILADNPSETVVHGLALAYGHAFGETARPDAKQDSHHFGYKSTIPLPAQKGNHQKSYSNPTVIEHPEGETVVDVRPDHPWKLVADNGQTYSLSSTVTTIGRRTTNTIVLFDSKVSRNHAEIRLEPAGYEIKDLDSANGILVNDERLAKKTPYLLQLNDKIQIGQTTFVCKEEK
jgi:hypothetical protein